MAAERRFYDDFSELRREVAGSKTVDHEFTSLGLPWRSTWSGSHSAQVTRGFNGMGQMTSMSDGSRTWGMTYDVWKGTPQSETFSVGSAPWKGQTHGFDDAGNYMGLTDPEGAVHEWPVDENNRVVEERYSNRSVKTVSYTPGGLPDREVLKDTQGVAIATTLHSYNRLGLRERSVTWRPATGEVVSDQGWTYDMAHRMTGISLGHLATDFTVGNDERGQVVSEGTPGNAGGLAAPAFQNTLGALPTGKESASQGEAQGRQ